MIKSTKAVAKRTSNMLISHSYYIFIVLGDSADKKVNGKTRSAIKDKYFFIRAPLRDI
jgi:hypothetical protein